MKIQECLKHNDYSNNFNIVYVNKVTYDKMYSNNNGVVVMEDIRKKLITGFISPLVPADLPCCSRSLVAVCSLTCIVSPSAVTETCCSLPLSKHNAFSSSLM